MRKKINFIGIISLLLSVILCGQGVLAFNIEPIAEETVISASPLSLEKLNQYLKNSSVKNAIFYDADIAETERQIQKLIEEGKTEHIFLAVNLNHVLESTPSAASGAVTRESFNNPPYSYQAVPIDAESENSLIKKIYQGFYGEKEDAGVLEETEIQNDFIAKYVGAVNRIQKLCTDHTVQLTVLILPVYYLEMEQYDIYKLKGFLSKLSNVTEFYDFSYTSLSFEPRYFKADNSFIDSVGDMILAAVFEDQTVYYPDDFGRYVTKRSSKEYLENYTKVMPMEEKQYKKEVPILIYHYIDPENRDEYTSPENFDKQLSLLKQAGYTTVTFQDLYRYTRIGSELPEKPIIITFDDGYYNNYEYAFPLLKKHNMKATIFLIGCSVGKSEYKDTGISMIPHFGWKEAKEMEDSGLIDIETHGYNFHEVEGRDPSPIRMGALQRIGETEEDYVSFLTDDARTMQELFNQELRKFPTVLAYPYGYRTQITDVVMKKMGIYATLTVAEKMNVVVKGVPESMFALGRYNMDKNDPPEILLSKIDGWER